MTLFVWVEGLEGSMVRINYLADMSNMSTILDEQYVHWLFWIYAYYGRTVWETLVPHIYLISPSYALLIPFIWFGKVELNHKTRYTEGYREGVESKRGTSPWYGKLQLDDLVSGYVPRLEVELELQDNRYLHIKEGGLLFPRRTVLPRLLPTFTL